MNDQAESLRTLIKSQTEQPSAQTKIVTVTSGKGGVGKSNFTLNFALELKSLGYRVLIFDADIGMANIDVLMGAGAAPKYNLHHLLTKQKTIWEIIHKGTNGLEFIAGGSGFNDLDGLSEEELKHFSDQVDLLDGYVDYIFFDTGAGLSKETLNFILSAHETIVVVTPEPTSITDAYAIIKMVSSMEYAIRFRLVINRVTYLKEGKQTADKITMAANRFLSKDIGTLGFVQDDSNVSKAVKRQIPFTTLFPNTPASKSIQSLALRFTSDREQLEVQQPNGNGVRGFLQRMIDVIKR